MSRKTGICRVVGAVVAMAISSCGYHPPSVTSRDEVLRLDQSHVALRVRGLADEDIPSLQSRENLQMLFFSDGHAVTESRVTDQGLRELSRLRLEKLSILDLGYCNRITDQGLVFVSRMSSVKSLSLMACPGVTDVGLRNLKGMRNLSRLDLRGCPGITDRGLSQLAAMENLREIQLGGCPKLSPKGVKRLQTLLPRTHVAKDETEWRYHQ